MKFKHTNVIHYDPVHAIEAFNKWSVDEIVVLNVSKKPESKSSFAETLERISKECFVPISAGGWITDHQYAQNLLRSGADKLILNTAFFQNPSFANELSDKYGKQCIVASMDVKKMRLLKFAQYGLTVAGEIPADAKRLGKACNKAWSWRNIF